MHTNLENVLKVVKGKVKKLLDRDDIVDVILFGSAVKGKVLPNDIDIAVLSKEKNLFKMKGFHVSTLNVEDIFKKTTPLITTLIREGISLKNERSVAEILGFKPRTMFTYKINDKNSSEKVKIVNTLRGRGNRNGLVKKFEGVWISKQVFLVPPSNELIFDEFFRRFRVKYKKFYLLIH